MKYILYFLSSVLLIYGLIFLFSPQKAKRIVHVSAYIVPFWVWGLFFVVFSTIYWKLGTNKNYDFIFSLIILFFLFKGIFLIFYPKRKIKKMIEKWENTPETLKKIHGVILVVIALLIYVVTRI